MLPSILRSFPLSLRPPSKEAAMSWRAPARAVACLWSWLPPVEGLVPAVSLLEGLPLSPVTDYWPVGEGEGDVFMEICTSTVLAAKPETAQVFCPQLHVYGQSETPPVITTCVLCKTAVN